MKMVNKLKPIFNEFMWRDLVFEFCLNSMNILQRIKQVAFIRDLQHLHVADVTTRFHFSIRHHDFDGDDRIQCGYCQDLKK